MFSKEFADSLNQTAHLIQQDQAARQLPAMEHLANVLRTLWREVERLEQHVSVSSGEVVLKTGGASIVLKADGTILIQGKEITVSGSGNIAIKADSRLTLKGSNVTQN
jgi:hypothetical protein